MDESALLNKRQRSSTPQEAAELTQLDIMRRRRRRTQGQRRHHEEDSGSEET